MIEDRLAQKFGKRWNVCNWDIQTNASTLLINMSDGWFNYYTQEKQQASYFK